MTGLSLVKATGELHTASEPSVLESHTGIEQEFIRCACTKINFYTLDARFPLGSSQKLGKLCDLFFDPACDLCGLVRVAGRLHNKPDDNEVHIAAVHTSVLIRCRSTGANDWWEIREVTDAVDDTTSYVVITPRRPVQEQWEIRQTAYSGFVCPVDDGADAGMWYARPLGRRVNMKLAKGWLTFCNEHHALECFNQEEADFSYPLRVIDCATRQIVWWSRGSSYVALSYVLGGKSANFRPTPNEMPFKLPSTLAPTFEDAILVTEALGVRYLWIDQYCIEQHNVADKVAQIGQMDSIYRHAWLTIVGAAGRDVEFGLPGISSRLRKPRRKATINQKLFMAVPPKPDVEMKKSTWMKRGWTYQEGILSHRVLVFSLTEIYFECDSLRCSEATDLPFNYDDVRLSPNEWHRRNVFPSIAHTESPGPFNDIFIHIQDYSKRQLSYPSDAQNAIQGILNSFERIYPQLINFCGLPLVPADILASFGMGAIRPFTRTEQLLRSLCWFSSRPGTRNTGFPSFSWLGWSMGDHYINASYGHIINSFDIDIYLPSPSPELSDTPFESWCSTDRHVRSLTKEPQSLLLDAKVINATIVPVMEGNVAYFRRSYFIVFPGKPNIMMKNDVHWTLRRGEPGNCNGTAHEENLLAIPLGEEIVQDDLADWDEGTTAERKVSRSYAMLLIKEVQDGWERVGLANFDSIGAGYMTPSTAQLSDGSTVRKRYYTPEAFRRLPFYRRRIRLI